MPEVRGQWQKYRVYCARVNKEQLSGCVCSWYVFVFMGVRIFVSACSVLKSM